jgi:hypothetical protein
MVIDEAHTVSEYLMKRIREIVFEDSNPNLVQAVPDISYSALFVKSHLLHPNPSLLSGS